MHFDVTYRFGEYRRFILAHVRAGSDELGFVPGLFFRSFLGWLFCFGIAAYSFPRKLRLVGPCAFNIDEQGLRRRSKQGEVKVPWADIVRIHRYEPGYLIDKGKGAFPIPYRCLDAEQRQALEVLIAAHAPQG